MVATHSEEKPVLCHHHHPVAPELVVVTAGATVSAGTPNVVARYNQKAGFLATTSAAKEHGVSKRDVRAYLKAEGIA